MVLSYSLNVRQTEIIFELSAMQRNIGLLISNYLNEYERHFNGKSVETSIKLTEDTAPGKKINRTLLRFSHFSVPGKSL